ncbi:MULTISPECIES: hypothetical protein [unclassified Herbaspirillum]|uniref:hypothetical protein n=1 Tax=unclassified Herbaspirillum TaxID=2624150 RepID=UPI0011508160|nr:MULTISPECIES: hypothetical protein [unclassified Herbaspirillum]MBB5390592.1 hypothetical protein [Herbaspirillum sp. SJZ102]TQK08920.1 hypothetical protein FB599_1277 [Herbaspirillum sp. SJZ130]TQK14393.1 hypothetical protein FB598_1765 [Herbaspirillum sp. SJZ106]TWC66591.1 hypothetical protein FB597_105177 [Herbaspirillum sp. SJZ099]
MPKIIHTVCEVIPEEGVRIRSAYLRNNLRASAVLDHARRAAGDLVAQAQEEVADRYREARAEGYAAGILQSLTVVADYLADHAVLAARLQERLRDETERLLRCSVDDPEVVMAAFEECLREQSGGTAENVPLELLLPDTLRAGHRCLMARLQQRISAPIGIDYHPHDRFVLRHGDYVAEFSAEDFVASASSRVMARLQSLHAACAAAADIGQERLAAMLEPASSPIPRSSPEHP